MSPPRRSGTVALVGRPNAGKSTLLNRLVGDRVAAVSDKPQTTRHRIVGIVTSERGQMVLHDTPGVHKGHDRLDRRMVETAVETLRAADVVCLVVDASVPFGGGDAFLLELLRRVSGPRVLALNKIDAVRKPSLLPLIARYSDTALFDEIVPLCALDGDGVDRLVAALWDRLPEGEELYPAELVTSHPERFLAAERIREQVLHHTRNELPFATAVLLDEWQEEGDEGLVRILATILVEKDGQRAIVIGRDGSMIKAISTAARLDLEEMLGRRVFLRATVRCEPGWRQSVRTLHRLEQEASAVALEDRDDGRAREQAGESPRSAAGEGARERGADRWEDDGGSALADPPGAGGSRG